MNTSKTRFLLTDEVHFHERNFQSLFRYFDRHGIRPTNAQAPRDWIALYGDYSTKRAELSPYVERLEALSREELRCHRYFDVPVFETCKLEMLAHLIAQPQWRERELSSDADEIFGLADALNRVELLENMATVLFWVDWWRDKLGELPRQDYCLIFSGSLIYSRVLIELLKQSTAEPFVLESFFTGNEYYCERKYEHLPNNSDLQHRTYLNSISLPEDADEYDRARVKAVNKILSMKNKNVTQPERRGDRFSTSGRPKMLILGQVLNDFSTLGTEGRINSVVQYQELIRGVLQAVPYDVIFKAHPWENKKIGLGAPVTKLLLNSFANRALLPEERSRFILIEEYNLAEAFEQVDYVVTLCSQAALEAAFAGFKPVQLGNAFYGGHGFTHDCSSISEFVADLARGEIAPHLTLDEYDAFEDFMTKALVSHLVCVHPSGVARLEEIFKSPNDLKLVGSPSASVSSGNERPVRRQIKSAGDVGKGAGSTSNGRTLKRLRKLYRDPHGYFRDSRFAALRLLKSLFGPSRQ